MDKETSLGEVQLYNTCSDFVTKYTIYEQPQPFTPVQKSYSSVDTTSSTT